MRAPWGESGSRRPWSVAAASLVATLLAAGGWGAAAPPNTPPPPAEVFGALPLQTDVVLSPDGHWLAWAEQNERQPHVVLFDLRARTTQRTLTAPEGVKLRSLVWSDNDTLLMLLSGTSEPRNPRQLARENFVIIAYNVGGGDGRRLPVLAGLVRAQTSKPHTVIMASFGPGSAGRLFALDTQTGKSENIKFGNEHTTAWVVDRDGKPVAREDWDWLRSAYRVYALSGNNIKEILRRDDSEPPTLAGLLPDDSALVLLAANGRSHQAAWTLPLDGSPARLLAEDSEADITSVYTDSNTGAIVGVYVSGSRTALRWLDAQGQHRYDVLQRAFPGREVWVYGWTADGSKSLAQVQSPTAPPVYYLVDFTTHRADIAAEEYPALAAVPLGEFRDTAYKARDGTTIPAYLTLPPPGKRSTPGPLVLLPHGGPHERDYPQFNWLVQFLASRGYAVLQPQFRGSIGFGDAFREAGYRQWGGLMQDDLTDGVRAMVEQGIADPRRVAIVGASYGGYAALAGAAFTPSLYACAASINGVTDLQALLREKVPPYGYGVPRIVSASQSVWSARIGKPNDPALASRSPINSVGSITIPILIIYGTGDGVVPNEQSQRMARALEAAGKSVTLARLPGEDHWLSRADARVQVLKELDVFLKSHL